MRCHKFPMPWVMRDIRTPTPGETALIDAFGQVAGSGTSTLYSNAAARVAALLESGNPDPALLSGLLSTAVAVQQFQD